MRVLRTLAVLVAFVIAPAILTAAQPPRQDEFVPKIGRAHV